MCVCVCVCIMQNYSEIPKNEILPDHGWTWRVLCLAEKVRHRKTNTIWYESHSYVKYKI